MGGVWHGLEVELHRGPAATMRLESVEDFKNSFSAESRQVVEPKT